MRIKGGANLVERQPAFSADGKLLLICTSCSVSVYSVATGLLVNQLEGHVAPVTSVNIVQYAGAARSVVNHVWTSSLDGTVRLWDFTTGSLIKTISVGRPIISMVIPGISKPEAGSPSNQCIAFLFVRWDKDLHDNGCDSQQKQQNGDLNGKKEKIPWKQLHDVHGWGFRVVLHDLTKRKCVPGHLAKVQTPQSLVCSPSGGLVGMVDCRKIWVWKVPHKAIGNASDLPVMHLHHTKVLRALAFDPTETVVAGGDDSGRILIWKNVGERSFNSVAPGHEEKTGHRKKNVGAFDINTGVRGDDDAAALITYHWHSDEVRFLAFSVDGAYLFSGGKEAVFVMWQLETGKQQFLPRLGSSLLYCASSSDASVYSVSCADNTIKFVDSSMMAVIKSIQGIKPPMSLHVRANGFNITRAAIEPEARSLVLPGEDMSLQFYDAFYDRSIGEVAVTSYNYVSSFAKGKKGSGKENVIISMVFVTHVVFSADSFVMATAECRLAEEEIGGSSCLKFWMRNSAKAGFCLNTRIDDPHSTDISSLAYHPSLNMAVSCSMAGEFKVWVQNENKRESENSPILASWRCRSVGSYQRKPMHCVAFSPDGTLLAVSCEEVITLWNPFSNGLVHVLASKSQNPIKVISFVPTTHHLIAASWGEQPQLTVWSLETLSICWSCDVKVKAIAVDSTSDHFAILAPLSHKVTWSKGNKAAGKAVIAIFNVDAPFPRAIWNAQDVKGSILFYPPPNTVSSSIPLDMKEQASQKSHLIFMNRRREYVMFNPFTNDEDSDQNSNERFHTVEKQGPSAFEAIFGKAVIPGVAVKSDISAKAVQPWASLSTCPSHLIPLTKIGPSYIESLLEKRTDES